MRIARLSSVLLAALVVTSGSARAAGPLAVNGAGTPLVWTASPVPFNPDLGTLGTLGNAVAVAAVTANFGVWTAVPTSTISFSNTGSLPVDVTVANYSSYLDICGDSLSPIVFDTDGTIIDDILGPGASNNVLGFAGPDCVTFVPPVITEGMAVLNGKFLDGIDMPGNPEVSATDFNAVFIHEFGHYANLDHSQINLTEAFDGNASNDDAVATMFPFLINGTEASTLSLDDEVSISTLYPEASFASGFGTLTGTIFLSDGTTPFQGAYVIARRVGDERITAVGAASGARYFPGNPGGPTPGGLVGLYELPGLPAGNYTVEVEEIFPGFEGGSSVGPFDTPVELPGPPEFYNGANEDSTDPPDDPTDSTSLAVVAGGVQSGLDVISNVFPPPPNDACGAATTIASLPFTESQNVSNATTDGSDPAQSCTFGGPSQNTKSVWYSYTAPVAQTISVDTFGSNYDTVLSAYSGTCGSLSVIACNEDAIGLLSRQTLSLTMGQTVLLEVTRNTLGGGGFALTFNVSEVVSYPGSYIDPIGDTIGAGSPQLDLSAISACSKGASVKITLAFATPITPADSGQPNALTGYVDLDVDQSDGTGGVPLTDIFSGATTGMGSDYVVDLFTVDSVSGTVDVFTRAGSFVGTASASFGPTSVAMTVPTSVIGGDDGALNTAAIVGSTTEPTDGAPNGGNVSTVSCLSCPAAPAGGCRQAFIAGKGSLQIKRNAFSDAKDQLQWKWQKGAATTTLEFGSPTTSTDYVACLYDDVAGVPTFKRKLDIPAGGTCAGKPCWKGSTKGFKYSDKTLAADGVKQLQLKAGIDGKAQISLQGKGSALDPPTLPLAQSPSVLMQLHGNGLCWEGQFSAPAKTNLPDKFQDKE